MWTYCLQMDKRVEFNQNWWQRWCRCGCHGIHISRGSPNDVMVRLRPLWLSKQLSIWLAQFPQYTHSCTFFGSKYVSIPSQRCAITFCNHFVPRIFGAWTLVSKQNNFISFLLLIWFGYFLWISINSIFHLVSLRDKKVSRYSFYTLFFPGELCSIIANITWEEKRERAREIEKPVEKQRMQTIGKASKSRNIGIVIVIIV